MNGILAQQIALASYGNDFLINNSSDKNFYSDNSTFKYCNKVDFRTLRKYFLQNKYGETIVSNDVNSWFEYLRSDGCQRLLLYYEHSEDQSFAKDHKLAGFVGGGGTWLIEAVYKSYSYYWENSWKVTQKDSPDNKIWSVKYSTVLKKKKILNEKTDFNICKEELRESLNNIIVFCEKQKIDFWEEWYKKAQSILTADKPSEGFYHPDMIVHKNYPLQAQQLLFSASSAWAFGGMGSWNDISFNIEGAEQEYNELSSKLYNTLNMTFISVLNSF